MSVSMKYVFACALGATLAVGGVQGASAQQRGGGGGGGGGRGAMTPLSYRQNVMQQLAQSLTALTSIQNGTVGSPEDLIGRATIVRELAMALSSAFPVGSGGGESRSLPAVWDKPTEVAAGIRATQMAAETLLASVEGGSSEAIASARTDIRQTCDTCHEQFRARPAGRGGN